MLICHLILDVKLYDPQFFWAAESVQMVQSIAITTLIYRQVY